MSSHSQQPENESLLAKLSERIESAGFHNYGFALLSTPFSIDLYDQWVKDGFHGEMTYLERHKDDKRDPQRLLKRASSAIVVTIDYQSHPKPVSEFPLSESSQIARYARGEDYHHFIRSRLSQLVVNLKADYPTEEFLTFTDSGAVLERDLAARAGLGWIGKNTCLIDRKQGSLFFIAEIYTSLVLPAAQMTRQELEQDFCGTCTRCIDACPTGAIQAPKVLDARLCISYLTIESRTVPPLHLREKIGGWLFGCDICQTVCPWNLKRHGAGLGELNSDRLALVQDLRMILTSGTRQLERVFKGTPLARAGSFGLKRNSIVVAANRGLHELSPEIESLQSHEKLGELAAWAIAQINTFNSSHASGN